MSEQNPVTTDEWRAFLTDFSHAVLTSPEQTVDRFDPSAEGGFITIDRFTPQVRESGWLGAEPCRESDIQEAETRLGCSLPTALRNFYLVSNGWSDAGVFGEDVWPIEKLEWARKADPELVDVWVKDVWGEDAEESQVLENSLIIGYADGGAGDYWLLRTPAAGDASEWTAYQWGPGSASDPEPYDNFATLMAEYGNQLKA